MTIKELRKQEKARADLRKNLRGEFENLEAEKAYLTKRAKAAAQAGDPEQCDRIADQLTEVNKRACVLAAEYRTTEDPRITAQEAQEVWNEMRGEYDKVFRAALENLDQAKQAFTGAMEAVLMLQGGALRDREELARLIGIEPAADTPGDLAYMAMELPTLPTEESALHYPCINYSGDVAYYAHLTQAQPEELLQLYRVVKLQRAAAE